MNQAPTVFGWRLVPSRLGTQVSSMLAVIVVIAMAGFYQLSSRRMDQAAQDSARHWAESLARTAASGLGSAAIGGDATAMDDALRSLASLPGVVRIDVVDAQGRPRLSLRHLADGRVQGDTTPTDMPLPKAGDPPTRSVTLADGEALQAWSPVGAGGAGGGVGVLFTADPDHSGLGSLRDDSLLTIASAGLLAVTLVHLLLLRALAPLRRLARFSARLAQDHGATLDQRAGSQEIRELTDALNAASVTLHEQWTAIRATEASSQAILNAVPDAVIGLDGEGRIGMVSPAVTSVFGYDPVPGSVPSLEALLPGIDLAEAERRTLDGLYMRASRSHLARFEHTARRVDGTEFPADVSLSRIESDEGVRYTCVVRDITEQRMAASIMNLYGRALECTSNGVVISDISLPGAPVFYVNPAFSRITGYEPGEIVGRNCGLLQRDDTAQPELQVIRDTVAAGGSCTVVVRNYRKDGSLFFNELAISPVASDDGTERHYVGVISDVTERERSRLAIAERSARLNAVFDLSPDGFVVFDKEDRLVYCNHAFLGMTGWSALTELGALSLAEFDIEFARLCDPAQPMLTVSSSLACERDGPQTLSLLMPQRRVLARVIRRQADGHGETILFFRDVTHETEVDRMKSEFLTTAAHELRTPMVSVFGFTELLLNRPVPEARRRDMLETIHRQSQRLINMVNELLDLARIEARQGRDLKLERCRLADLLRDAVAPFAADEASGRLRVALDGCSDWLWVDPEKTLRVFTNVLSNAVKYSPPETPIDLTVLRGQLRGEPSIGVRVRDRGMGMTPEQLERVFERFYRADPSGNIPGTGLGMSLVKEITELQGGEVDVQSRPGSGTVVTLWWPISARAAVEAQARQA